MAEGWTRHLKGDVIEAYSAGIETHGLNENAVRVMAEAGVDILVVAGTEAGGHCGEVSTMVLVPEVAEAVKEKEEEILEI